MPDFINTMTQFAKDFSNPAYLQKFRDMGATDTELKSLAEQIAGSKGQNYNQLVSDFTTMLQDRQKTQGVDTQIQDRYKMLSDPNSEYYQMFKSNLEKQLARTLEKTTPTTQSLLAVVLAQGLGYKAASKIASEQKEASESKARDYVSQTVPQATNEFFLSSQGQASNVLGMGVESNQFSQNMALQYAQMAEQKRQYEDSKPSIWDELLGAGLGVGSYALGGALGNTTTTGVNPTMPSTSGLMKPMQMELPKIDLTSTPFWSKYAGR